MKILIIGGTGMLGSSIMLSETNHELWGTFLNEKPLSKNISKLDITNQKQVKDFLNFINPDAIIHTAAITNVDLCEEKPNFAKEVHVNGTRHLVNICKDLGTYFLYISTDSVFDGEKGNYNEKDEPNPLNVYAKTKFEGELETIKYANSSVIRTNIYGFNWLSKLSITEWILKLLRDKKQITLFKDVFFSPILVNNFTEALIEIVEKKITGIYHVACPESITKCDFGRKIANIYNLDSDLIKPISISELNLKAPRPLNPTLNCSKIQRVIKTKLLNIEEGLIYFKNLENSGYLTKIKNL
jgi:dTDP-4-dehydrorhamnose reductase